MIVIATCFVLFLIDFFICFLLVQNVLRLELAMAHRLMSLESDKDRREAQVLVRDTIEAKLKKQELEERKLRERWATEDDERRKRMEMLINSRKQLMKLNEQIRLNKELDEREQLEVQIRCLCCSCLSRIEQPCITLSLLFGCFVSVRVVSGPCGAHSSAGTLSHPT